MSPFRLLREPRFGPFFFTQFFGAFNDNLFKSALLIYVAFRLSDSGTLVNVAQALFILPFFLFSSIAGPLADKVEKSHLIRQIKAAEIGIMIVAAIALALGDVAFLLGLLFCMGVQSAFFGPVKYAILPQTLRDDELVGGNGMIEMGTFLAILLGTLAGGPLIASTYGAYLVGGTVVTVALAGWFTSARIPPCPSVDPGLRIGWNLIGDSWRIIQTARKRRTVFNSILGISWFWAFGAILLAQLPAYTKTTLGGDELVVTLLLGAFSFGIGVGSIACERLSGRLIEVGLVPFGAFGMSVFGFDLVAASGPLPDASLFRICADLFLLAMFGGFFIVPLYALVQSRSDPEHRSRIIAANNILNALFVVAGALAATLLLARGITIPALFFVAVACNVAVAIYIFTLVPEFLARFITWMLVHTIYRLRITGISNVPDQGPAIIVCNHVSFVDALIISAACPRPIRFVMDHRIFNTRVLNFVFRTTRAIPIASQREDPKLMQQALDSVAEGLSAGDLVGIFPEGQLTRSGEIGRFRPGIERIVAANPVPVIPMALSGLWGSFFSHCDGPAMSKPGRLVRRFRGPIALTAGPPIAPPDLDAARLLGSRLACGSCGT